MRMSGQSDTWATARVRPIHELDSGKSVYHPTMATEPEQNPTQRQDEGQTPAMDEAQRAMQLVQLKFERA